MISLLYLASALILGTAVTKRLGIKLYPFEIPALSLALCLLLWTWLSLILALLAPYKLSLPLTLIVAAFASAICFSRSPKWLTQDLPGRGTRWILWCTFTTATAILIGGLMWNHYLIPSDGALYSANASWADLGLHASLISHFAATTHLPLDFPVATGVHLTYPFLVDLLSAWYVYGGWSLHLAIFVPSLLLILAFLQLTIGFCLRVFRSLDGAIAGLTLTLFCGSAAGLFVALSDLHSSSLSLGTFLGHLPQDYTILASPNAQLGNFLADAVLPQRAFALGFASFAATSVLLAELRQRPKLSLALSTGALIGLMPLAHAHSFVVASAMLAALYMESVIKTRRLRNVWLLAGLTTLAIALPQLLWQTFANGTGTGGHLSLGWTLMPNESLLGFWVHNYGLTLILIVIITLSLLTKKLRPYLVWYAPFVALFILANIYSLQPFSYDNYKIILYAYLFTFLFASYGTIWLIKRHRLLLIPAILIALFMSTSGALSIMREYQHHDQFASRDDIALSSWVQSSTLPTDVFFTTDQPNQPIATLAGRSLVAGYRGWLYNYHIDYNPRLEAIQAALNGNTTRINPYHAKYLAVAAYEPEDWTVNRAALTANYQTVYSNPTWTVYLLPEK